MPLSIPPISPSAAGASAIPANESSRTPRSDFADKFAKASNSNDPTCFVFDMRRGAKQLEQAPPLQTIAPPRTEAQQSRDKEKQVQRDEAHRTFSDLCGYFGLASINDVYAGNAPALNCRNLIDKMEMDSGNNLSRREKDGSSLLARMKFIGSQPGLQSIATAMSIDRKSQEPSDKFYLGLTMTMAHVKKLHDLSKTPSSANAVKTGKFLSVGKERGVEVNSAKECPTDQTQVLLEIKGFSNKNLKPHQGVSDPANTMFGPHATFRVDAVGPGSKNTELIIVRLTEIAEMKNAVSLLS